MRPAEMRATAATAVLVQREAHSVLPVQAILMVRMVSMAPMVPEAMVVMAVTSIYTTPIISMTVAAIWAPTANGHGQALYSTAKTVIRPLRIPQSVTVTLILLCHRLLMPVAMVAMAAAAATAQEMHAAATAATVATAAEATPKAWAAAAAPAVITAARAE